MPLFAAMGGPLLTLYNIPTTLWYTHRSRTRQLEAALRLSRRVVTAVPDSFPIPSPRVRAIGHGVDTDFYTPPPQPAEQARVVHVARLTPIKHQHVLLQAAAPLGCEVVLVGGVPDGYDDAYSHRLRALADELGMTERVVFAGAQTPEQVRAWYHSATAAVNLSPPGLFDKAALESMACAVPTVVSSTAFRPVTGAHDVLHLPAPGDVEALRSRLRDLLGQDTATRRRIGEELRAGVEQQHSLHALVPKLLRVLDGQEP